MMESSLKGYAVSLSLHNIVFIILCTSITVNGNGDCRTGMPQTQTVVPFREKCYQFVYDEKRWPEARDFCWENGGRLVSIPDEETSNFISTTLDSISDWDNNGVWIGLHDRVTEHRFDWVGRSPEHGDERMVWDNWAPGEPVSGWLKGGDCTRMVRAENWQWKETPCDMPGFSYKSICEYDPIVRHTKPRPSAAPPAPPAPPQRSRGFLPPDPDPRAHEEQNEMFTTQQPQSTEAEEELLNEVFVDNVGKSGTPAKSLGGPQPNAEPGEGRSHKKGIIAGVVATVVGATAITLIVVLVALKRRRKSVRGRRAEGPPGVESCGDMKAEFRAGDKTVTYSLDNPPCRNSCNSTGSNNACGDKPKGGKTVTYCLDGDNTGKGNLYVDHCPGGAMGKVPGTPHPRSGVAFPRGFDVDADEEDGYMIPRGPPSPTTHAGYTPVSRGGKDPLPGTPTPSPAEGEYEEPVGEEGNMYECIDDVLEKIKYLEQHEEA